MKTTIITNSNEDTNLITRKVKFADFDNFGQFMIFCAENNVNGDWRILWSALECVKEINVFSPKEG
jgi:hypothetical protein